MECPGMNNMRCTSQNAHYSVRRVFPPSLSSLLMVQCPCNSSWFSAWLRYNLEELINGQNPTSSCFSIVSMSPKQMLFLARQVLPSTLGLIFQNNRVWTLIFPCCMARNNVSVTVLILGITSPPNSRDILIYTPCLPACGWIIRKEKSRLYVHTCPSKQSHFPLGSSAAVLGYPVCFALHRAHKQKVRQISVPNHLKQEN